MTRDWQKRQGIGTVDRLVAWRLMFLSFCGLPSLFVAWGTLSGGAARQAYYTAHDMGVGALPLVRVERLLSGLSPVFFVAAALGALAAVILDLLLTAGAIATLDDENRDSRRIGVVLRRGATHLAPVLRILVMAVVGMAAGAGLIDLVFDRIDVHGHRAHWDAARMYGLIPLARTMLTLLWISLVGALSLVCRVVTVCDGRRVVRRSLILTLQVCWRHPIRALATFSIVTLIVEAIAGLVMVGWRLPIAEGTGQAAVRSVLWLAMLFVQAWVWRALVATVRGVYVNPGDERVLAIRARPDAGFALPSRLYRRLRRPR